MPKKIRNPLRDGMPSKIYLAAYPKAISGYEIGKKIQGVDNPRTDQIYKIVDKYKDLFERSKTKGARGMAKPILSKAEPLLEDIEKAITTKLSEDKKRSLLKVLDSKEFRSFVGDQLKNIDFKDDVNASKTIQLLLCMIVSACLPGRILMEEKARTIKDMKEARSIPEVENIIDMLIHKLNVKKVPEDLVWLCLENIPAELMERLSEISVVGRIVAAFSKTISSLFQEQPS